MATSETKWTPGPWRVDTRFFQGENGVLDAAGWSIADTSIWQHRKASNGRLVRREIADEEQIANARLIAAAPDLHKELARLIALLEPLERDGGLNVPGLATLNGARAALAKAEG